MPMFADLVLEGGGVKGIALVGAMTGVCDQRHIDDPAVAARTIVVDTGTVRATDFSLNRDTQDSLFQKGREAAVTFLDGAPGQPAWDWEAYKRAHRSADHRHQRYFTCRRQDQAGPDARDPGTGFRGKRHCEHARPSGQRAATVSSATR